MKKLLYIGVLIFGVFFLIQGTRENKLIDKAFGIEVECTQSADCGSCYRCSGYQCVYNCITDPNPTPPPAPKSGTSNSGNPNTGPTATPPPSAPTGGSVSSCGPGCCSCVNNQCTGWCGGPGLNHLYIYPNKSNGQQAGNQSSCQNYAGNFNVTVTARCTSAEPGLDCGTGQWFTPSCSWEQCGPLHCTFVKDHYYEIKGTLYPDVNNYYNDGEFWSSNTRTFTMTNSSGDGNQSFTLNHQCNDATVKLFISNGLEAYSETAITEKVAPVYFFTQVIDSSSGYAISPTYTNGRIDYSRRVNGSGTTFTNINSLQNENAFVESTWTYGAGIDDGTDYQVQASYEQTTQYCATQDTNVFRKRACTANTNTVLLGLKPSDGVCANATFSSSPLSVPQGTDRVCVKVSNATRPDIIDLNIYNETNGQSIKNPAGIDNGYGYTVSGLSAGTYTLRADSVSQEPYCGASDTNLLTITAVTATPTPTNTPTPTITPTFTPTPTPIPQACTVSGHTPTSGCFNTNPTFNATYGNGADRIQFAVDDTLSSPGNCSNPFGSSWVCNSGFQSGSTYSCPLLSGNYYWSARASSSITSCLTSCFAPTYSFSIDKTAPATPTINTPTCADQSTSTVQFTFNSSDTYCGALGTANNKAHSYHVQVYDDKGNWYLNNWYNPSTKTILTTSGWVATTYACSTSTYDSPCLRIPANSNASSITLSILNTQDSLGNQNSSTVATQTYTLYPSCQLPATISGSFFEDKNSNAIQDSGENLVSGANINVVLTYSGGGSPATVNCSYPTAQTYTCTLSNFANGATYNVGSTNLSPYSSQTGCTGPSGSCSVTFNKGDTKNLSLGFDKGAFLQTGGGSIHAGGGVSMEIPSNPLHFDTGAATSRVMVLNPAGAVTSNGSQVYSQTAGAQSSTPNYKDSSYTNGSTQFDYEFFDNKFANKYQIVTPSGAASLSNGRITDGTNNWNLTNNTVYKVNGNLTVQNDTLLSNVNTVILVNGNLTISNNFRSINNNSYLAFIVSGSVTIDPSVSEVHALLMSNGQFSDAPGATTLGLKIIGAIHSHTGFTLNRRQNTDRPGEYIVEDPAYFIKLATPLGLSSHNWEEVNP